MFTLKVRNFMTTYSSSSTLTQLQDNGWIRQSLFVPYRGSAAGGMARDTDGSWRFNQSLSYASLMFEDTALGGSKVMNPKPQACRFADPKLSSIIATVQTNLDYTGKKSGRLDQNKTLGEGRWYAEKIAANVQYITLQAGTPITNSLTNFMTGFYDPYHADMINTGVVGGMAFNIGAFVGYVVGFAIAPLYMLSSFAYSTGKKIYADLARRPLSKFYYVKPTMAIYWSTVQGIMNAITVNLRQQGGLNPGSLIKGNDGATIIDKTSLTKDANSPNDEADLAELVRVLPDVFLDEKGSINVKAVATRYERLADAHERKLMDIKNSYPKLADVTAAINTYLQTGLQPNDVPPMTYPDIHSSLAGYALTVAGMGTFLVDTLLFNKPAVQTTDKQGETIAIAATSIKDNKSVSSILKAETQLSMTVADHLQKYADYMEAELRDGSAFVSFAVDYERTVSESFSSTTKPSDIAGKMNDTSRVNREKLFSVANGNIGDSFIADSVESFLGLASKVVQGTADAVGLSGLAMLGGRAFVDIPEFWDSSDVTMPSTSYVIPLRSWSGHPTALLQNIYFPLAMLLPFAAARSAGRAAYSNPFYCKMWQKGYAQIQTGIVTSFSITRGAGNLGWNEFGQPIAVDVHITIKDLSSITHIPITVDLSLKDIISLAGTGYAVSMFDEDTKFTDLMAVWSSLGLADQYYASNRWRIRNAKKQQNFDSFWTMDNLMTWARGTAGGDIVSFFVKQGHITGH
jgi:hypothetical protein